MESPSLIAYKASAGMQDELILSRKQDELILSNSNILCSIDIEFYIQRNSRIEKMWEKNSKVQNFKNYKNAKNQLCNILILRIVNLIIFSKIQILNSRIDYISSSILKRSTSEENKSENDHGSGSRHANSVGCRTGDINLNVSLRFAGSVQSEGGAFTLRECAWRDAMEEAAIGWPRFEGRDFQEEMDREPKKAITVPVPATQIALDAAQEAVSKGVGVECRRAESRAVMRDVVIMVVCGICYNSDKKLLPCCDTRTGVLRKSSHKNHDNEKLNHNGSTRKAPKNLTTCEKRFMVTSDSGSGKMIVIVVLLMPASDQEYMIDHFYRMGFLRKGVCNASRTRTIIVPVLATQIVLAAPKDFYPADLGDFLEQF
uniref:DEAD domain-containing protein n=1 Tax=Elaeophora elaphi TaxID=1147741 RepID=A0A0R3S5R8_9BILA